MGPHFLCLSCPLVSRDQRGQSQGYPSFPLSFPSPSPQGNGRDSPREFPLMGPHFLCLSCPLVPRDQRGQSLGDPSFPLSFPSPSPQGNGRTFPRDRPNVPHIGPHFLCPPCPLVPSVPERTVPGIATMSHTRTLILSVLPVP